MLRLNPLLSFIEDRRADAARRGLFHRWTGESLDLTGPLAELLQLLAERALTADEAAALAATPAGREACAHLERNRFLVAATDAHSLLQPFLDARLLRPAMNPALAYREGERARIVRLRHTDRCLLPRDATPPELVDEELPADAARLLASADGVTTPRRLLERGLSEARLWQALDWLTRPERQLVRLLPAGEQLDIGIKCHYPVQSFYRSAAAAAEAGEARADTAAASAAAESAAAKSAAAKSAAAKSAAAKSAAAYYHDAITDAEWNFDWVEPTVNHAFRHATAAFDQRPYGARFYAALCEAGLVLPGAELRVLEVGGGTGSFARDFIDAAHRDGSAPRYSILDHSPALSRRQEERLRGAVARFLVGDARDLGALDERFDVIIANEMIADLPVEPRRQVAPERLARLDGSVAADGEAKVHTGALAFLEQIAARLAPAGCAVLTEYGELEAPPVLVTHLNHPEYSIQFAQLMAYARHLGLAARLLPLGRFLAARDDAELLVGQQEHVWCLNRLLARRGLALPYAAFCRAGFEGRYGAALDELQVSGPSFAPLVRGLHFGPRLDQFHALILTRAPRDGVLP